MREGLKTLFIALRATAITLVLTGLLYPLGMTGLSRILFPSKSRGSLVADEQGRVVGSALIGQRFTQAAYFQPRPSSGSNLGPTSKKLRERAQQEIARLRKENPEQAAPIPADLVTASASGLDPHLSTAGARWQVPRVARARGVTPDRIDAIIGDHIEGRELGLLGEPRVNVLLLNLALDQRFGRPGPG